MSLRPNPHSPFSYTRPPRPRDDASSADRLRQVLLALLAGTPVPTADDRLPTAGDGSIFHHPV